MKWLILFIFFILLVGASAYAWIHRQEIVSPCLPPLEYRVGDVDPQFGISREEFAKLIAQAESIWENALGHNLFIQNESAQFAIHLTYDERQSKTKESKFLEQKIDTKKEDYDTLSKKLDNDLKTHEKLVAQYENQIASYEKNFDQLESRINDINARGGATESEQKEITKEQDSLEKERNSINALASQINALSESSRHLIKTINSTANTINTDIETRNDLFADNPEFEKGLYQGKNIVIYQYTDKTDLLLTLVHEMGHALHIQEHTENPQSIMHYLMKNQSRDPITLTHEDVEVARESCRLDIDTPQEYLAYSLQFFANIFPYPDTPTNN